MKHSEDSSMKNMAMDSGSWGWEEGIGCWSGYVDAEQMGREVTKEESFAYVESNEVDSAHWEDR